jgi:hypothetical protein
VESQNPPSTRAPLATTAGCGHPVRTLVLVADGNFNPEGGQHTMFHILEVR